MPTAYEKFRERLDMFPQGFPKTKVVPIFH